MEIWPLLFLIGLVSGAPTSLGDEDSRILGGTEAKQGQFPYVAAVVADGSALCGAFIYNYENVVTAAGCVHGKTSYQINVTVGMTSQITPGPKEKSYRVSSIIANPSYNQSANPLLHDIAILKIQPGIQFDSEHVDLIYYQEVDSSIPDATIMGWGLTHDGGLQSSKLLYASATLTGKCESYYSTYYDPNYMICGSDRSASPCQYDTGSPVVQNGVAVGIIAKSLSCSAPPLPFVFVRLSSYFGFLKANAGQQITTTTQSTTPCQTNFYTGSSSTSTTSTTWPPWTTSPTPC